MKECAHCGGPNAPENRVCDYCGMSFDADTIPEGSIDPREQARIDAAARREAAREKQLVELNLDKTDNQNVTINMPGGQKIVINDPIEKAAALAGSALTGSAASAMKQVSGLAGKSIPGLEDDPRFGPGTSGKVPQRSSSAAKKKSGFLGKIISCLVLLIILMAVMFFLLVFGIIRR